MPNRSMSQDWELSHPLAGVASVWSRRTYTIEASSPGTLPGRGADRPFGAVLVNRGGLPTIRSRTGISGG